MVFLPIDTLGYMPSVHTWLASRMPEGLDEYMQQVIRELFVTMLPRALTFLRKECTESIASADINLCTTCCLVFESVFIAVFSPGSSENVIQSPGTRSSTETRSPRSNKSPVPARSRSPDGRSSDGGHSPDSVKSREARRSSISVWHNNVTTSRHADDVRSLSHDVLIDAVKAIFAFSLVWSVGANVDAEGKEKFRYVYVCVCVYVCVRVSVLCLCSFFYEGKEKFRCVCVCVYVCVRVSVLYLCLFVLMCARVGE